MSNVQTCVLPGGYLDAERICHRNAALVPLRGCDEEAFQTIPAATSETRAVTELLSTAVKTIGRHPMTPEVAGALTPADREVLLLKLWEASFSSRVEMVLSCPRPSCRAPMDMDFDTSAIAAEARPQEPLRNTEIGGHQLAFRVPLADDIEAVAQADRSDRLTALIARCVLSIDGRVENVEGLVAGFTAEIRGELAAEIERACPRLEAEFEAACPECGARFDVPYDPVAHLFTTLRKTHPQLEREVHVLSFYYHWPLDEILQMSRPARQRYVRVLTRELAAASGGGALS